MLIKFKKSQSAFEFTFLASFMLLVIVSFFGVTSSKALESREEANRKTAEDIAEYAYREIEIAISLNDGYSRTFKMPERVNGIDYGIKMNDGIELVTIYLGNEYVKYLPADKDGKSTIVKASSSIKKGENCISKSTDPITNKVLITITPGPCV